MALMFPWATKEYLLWDMTIGQIFLYYNKAIEIKYPRKDDGFANAPGFVDKSPAELRQIRDEMKERYGAIE